MLNVTAVIKCNSEAIHRITQRLSHCLSLCFLYYGGQFAMRKTNDVARRLLLASIVYLPVVFVLLVLDRR